MSKFTKKLLTGVIALGLMAPVAAPVLNNTLNTTVHASRTATTPRRYRHNWYRHFPGWCNMEYKIGAHYAYFSDSLNRHYHGHGWIKYRLIHLRHGWYGTVNHNYQATPFKMFGRHLTIRYDVAKYNLYR